MYCPNCGKEVPVDANVCPDCGKVLKSQSAAGAPVGGVGVPVSTVEAPVRTVVETPVRAAAAADAPVSVGDWFVTLLLTCIPIVGIIMIFVWAFGGGTNPSKKNWARATLIWALVGIVLSVVFGASIVALFANALS